MLDEFDSVLIVHVVFRGHDVESSNILNSVCEAPGSVLVLLSLGTRWDEVTHWTLLRRTERISSYS